MAEPQRSNFAHLARLQPDLARFGSRAERLFAEDPNTCLLKLRQFAELMAQQVAARAGLYLNPEENQADLLGRLKLAGWLPRETADMFHVLRKVGNAAMHQNAGDHRMALESLKFTNQLGQWFQRSFGKPDYRAAFVPPSAPVDETESLKQELADLEAKRQQTETALKAEAEKSEAVAAEVVKALDDAKLWEQLAQEAEREKSALIEQLASLQAEARAKPEAELRMKLVAVEQAASLVDLDEKATRALIDQQLQELGWETDSVKLDYRRGTRPERSRNMAIAEWPCENGDRADYALFIGTELVGIIEAKRVVKNVAAHLQQAQRYARGILGDGGEILPAKYQGEFRVPLVFASNGRPYLKQYQEASGIWFRDLRRSANHAHALPGFYTPTGINELLKQDIDAAEAKLDALDFNFDFPLRGYQRDAILAVEGAIRSGKRQALVAMATGTGKTKTCIALVYRLLTAQRFRRILFLVDRSALGEQAGNAFNETRIVDGRTFADDYGIKLIDESEPDPSKKVHIATVQGMVKRVVNSDTPLPVDEYDCIVVDECHRGYLLDREMGDAELKFRNQADYVSSYSRVIGHFDAVKIGLTATPALHTTQLFGNPVFAYSYQQAVLEKYLVNHEPAQIIETELSRDGIKYKVGEEVLKYDPRTAKTELFKTPDELKFDVTKFNKKVITPNFNKVVCEALADRINPFGSEKTLIFCANDAHADMVVNLLKDAFKAKGIEVDDDAVLKITGNTDKPLELIRRYKNENNPVIAVTVDLLTTGIDVPEICNLVFIRRVNSRILYEQMLGRATRLCESFEKNSFNIYDAVGIYAGLEAINSMQPVAVNPRIPFAVLVDEIRGGQEIAPLAKSQMLAKFRSKQRHLDAEQRESLKASGHTPESFAAFLLKSTVTDLGKFFDAHPKIGEALDAESQTSVDPLVISGHADKLVGVTPEYGKPEDYLLRFQQFIEDLKRGNKLPALMAVVQRPRELTRTDLLELVRVLEAQGFTEPSLRAAWAQKSSHEIAAGVLGFVRQAALGEALLPWDERVDAAIREIKSTRTLNKIQSDWLVHLAKQLKSNLIVDETAFNDGALRRHGTFKRVNQLFEGKLPELLADLNEAIWQQKAS